MRSQDSVLASRTLVAAGWRRLRTGKLLIGALRRGSRSRSASFRFCFSSGTSAWEGSRLFWPANLASQAAVLQRSAPQSCPHCPRPVGTTDCRTTKNTRKANTKSPANRKRCPVSLKTFPNPPPPGCRPGGSTNLPCRAQEHFSYR